jgi:DNA-binding MarR family transcriptional regulator
LPDTASNPDFPDLAEFMCFAVYAANSAFGRAYRPLLEGLGLTYPQYLVMVTLWAEDGQTVGSIGQKLFLESNTLTPLLKRLEALGYVTRTRSTQDERQVMVHLTEAGRAMQQTAHAVPQGVTEAMDLDPESATRLRTDLIALRERLKGNAEP